MVDVEGLKAEVLTRVDRTRSTLEKIRYGGPGDVRKFTMDSVSPLNLGLMPSRHYLVIYM